MTRIKPSTPSAIGQQTTLAALSALLLLIVLVYWPGLNGGFIFDDRPNISANVALHVNSLHWRDWLAATLSSPAANFPRPLAMLSFAINHYFTGLDPWPMKLTNVAIHAGNTVLVFLLSRTLVRVALARRPTPGHARWAPLFMAAAWGLHPINLMAVLYVVQRMESLCHTFVFAGLLLYIAGRERLNRQDNGWPLILCGLFAFAALGALAKESALLLPLYGFCLELCLFQFKAGTNGSRTRLTMLYVVGLLVPALLALWKFLPPVLGPNPFPGRDFNLWQRLFTELRVVVDYLQWTLYPSVQQLAMYHDDYPISRSLFDPASTFLALIALLALGALALAVRRRRPLLALGLLWFLAAQSMTATIIPLELVFEHRNYFASFGICLALGDLLLLTLPGPRLRLAGAGLAIAFVLLITLATGIRAWEWRNPLSFAISEAAKHPNSPRAMYAFGVALSNLPGLSADSPTTAAAFETLDHARELPNSNILPDQAALMLASRLGLPLKQKWWLHMQSRLRERPIGPQELAALGALNACSLEHRCNLPADAMLATFQAALSQGPHPEVQSILGGYLLNVLQRPDLALYLWHEAAERSPNEPQYRISLIKLLVSMCRNEDAKEEIASLRKLGRLGQYDGIADGLDQRRKAVVGSAPCLQLPANAKP